ncbi:MAG: NADH:flavin oxidoreductase [Kiritimatiellia bacterium]
MKDVLFQPLALPRITLPNRIIRSATYEGLGDEKGLPRSELAGLYTDLARGGAGAIITGFVFVSQSGRAMQPRQCGMDDEEKQRVWSDVVGLVKTAAPGTPLFMQLAHAGRQTRRENTGLPVRAASGRACTYFKQTVSALREDEVPAVASEFALAAARARAAGFDGVQIHAAHGYLVHQFLSPWTNTRRDRWADGPLFLETIIDSVRERCGNGFPVLVKLSAEEDRKPGIGLATTRETARRLAARGVDAVEISYGTMEYALNIMRGDCPVDLVFQVNPLFNRMPRLWLALWKRFRMRSYKRRWIPFSENYNVSAAAAVKAGLDMAVYSVGGLRARPAMEECLTQRGLDAVGLCRPLLRDPGLPFKLRGRLVDRSSCRNCNICTIRCDAPNPVRCVFETRKEEA